MSSAICFNLDQSGNGLKSSSENATYPLLNNTLLHWSKLKAFADNKINVTTKIEFCF